MTDSARDGRPGTFAREVARKTIHLTSSAVPVLLAFGTALRIVEWILLVCFAAAIVVEIARRRSSRVALGFNRVFGSLLRTREQTDLTGATWLLGAMLIAVVLLPREIAIASTWAVAVGDASAAIIGMYFGRHRTLGSNKSLEGSVTCMIVSALGALLLARMSVAESILVGVMAAVAERLPWPDDDNARIVIIVGAAAWLWRAVSY